MSAPQKETRGFQTEVRQLLKLMIHSLYSNREIFLRELVSNASDANDRLRFASIAQPGLMGTESDLAIWIDADRDKGTLTIRDNGIGMTREEAVEHLGVLQEPLRRPAEGLPAHRSVRRRVLFGLHRRRSGRGIDPKGRYFG